MDGDAPRTRQQSVRARLWSILWHVAFIALVAAGVYIAWRVHLAMEASAPEQPPASTPGQRTVFPPSPIELQGPGPGFESLQADPGGFPPPPGARRLWSGRVKQHDLARQIARYRFRGEAAEVRRHYRRLLDEAGFRLALTTRDPRSIQRDIWQRGRDGAVLSLRPGQENEKLVLFWLTVWVGENATKP